jgi:isoquinoline 1-oxidoreductase subunit beta
MNQINGLGRRSFLTAAAIAGGGLMLRWSVPPAAAQTGSNAGAGAELGIWVVIQPDDTTIVRIARSEMGQGTLTGLIQLVADELDADWRFVKAEYVAPEVNLANKRAWGDMSTGGSRGIRASVDYVRKGGATARAMLLQAAAAKWSVPVAECTAAMSVITHTPTGRRARYGELAADAARVAPPNDVKVKQPSEWKIIGRGVKRLDTQEKLSGKLTFAIDVQLPDMLNAAIMQCPVFGGTLTSFDADKISAMPGVRHVLKVDDQSVAVVADKWYQAKTALAALPIVWDEGRNGNVDSAQIAAFLREGLDAKEAALCQQHGDVAGALTGAAKKVEAVYGTPFLNHATLEPMNCTARYMDGKVEIWVPSQNGDASLAAAAEAAGVKLSEVKVNKHHLGGGFGRRGQQDYTRQAVLIAKQVPGRPVKLIWTREEDMRHGFYRPITQAKMTGALDADGNVTALHARISGQSILAYLAPQRMENGVDRIAFQGWIPEEFGYMAIPNLLIDHAVRNTHAGRVLAWREHQPEYDLHGVLHRRTGAHGGQGPAGVPPDPDGEEPEASGGAERGRRTRWLGDAAAQGRVSRHRAECRLRQLCRGGGGGFRLAKGRAEGPPHRRSNRSRPCGEPGSDRGPGGGVVRLWPRRDSVQRNHDREGPGGAGQFRYLPGDAPGRHAEGGDCDRSLGRLLGRRG